MRHAMSLAEYREWRRKHYSDGTPRTEDEISYLLGLLLETKYGTIAVLKRDRLEAKYARRQSTPPSIKDAQYLHVAYGRKRGKNN